MISPQDASISIEDFIIREKEILKDCGREGS